MTRGLRMMKAWLQGTTAISRMPSTAARFTAPLPWSEPSRTQDLVQQEALAEQVNQLAAPVRGSRHHHPARLFDWPVRAGPCSRMSASGSGFDFFHQYTHYRAFPAADSD